MPFILNPYIFGGGFSSANIRQWKQGTGNSLTLDLTPVEGNTLIAIYGTVARGSDSVNTGWQTLGYGTNGGYSDFCKATRQVKNGDSATVTPFTAGGAQETLAVWEVEGLLGDWVEDNNENSVFYDSGTYSLLGDPTVDCFLVSMQYDTAFSLSDAPIYTAGIDTSFGTFFSGTSRVGVFGHTDGLPGNGTDSHTVTFTKSNIISNSGVIASIYGKVPLPTSPVNPSSFSNVKLLIGADSSISDESNSAHTLTLNNLGSGTPSQSSSVRKFGTGNGIYFPTTGTNSGSSITIPDSADWDLGTASTPFTIEAWIWMERLETAGGATMQHIINQWDSTATNAAWYFAVQTLNTDVLEFGYNVGSTSYFFQDTAENFLLHRWHHVAVDCDGAGTIRFFRNGTMTGKTTTAATSWNTSTRIAQIGARWGDTNNCFKGWMDEIRLIKGENIYGSDASFGSPNAAWARS